MNEDAYDSTTTKAHPTAGGSFKKARARGPVAYDPPWVLILTR